MSTWKCKNIHLGMLFKKRYCHKCGEKLKKHKRSQIYYRYDSDFSEARGKSLGGFYPTEMSLSLSYLVINSIRLEEIIITTYFYKCPHCGNEIEYTNQLDVEHAQKVLNKKVVTEEEINCEEVLSEKIKKQTKKVKISFLFLTLATILLILSMLIINEKNNWFFALSFLFELICFEYYFMYKIRLDNLKNKNSKGNKLIERIKTSVAGIINCLIMGAISIIVFINDRNNVYPLATMVCAALFYLVIIIHCVVKLIKRKIEDRDN